jgi:hypothetical protein
VARAILSGGFFLILIGPELPERLGIPVATQVTLLSEGKNQEILTKKKPVPKAPWYFIRIELGPDRIVHQLQRTGGPFEPLDSLPTASLREGKFGFIIAPGQQLSLANFSAVSDH